MGIKMEKEKAIEILSNLKLTEPKTLAGRECHLLLNKSELEVQCLLHKDFHIKMSSNLAEKIFIYVQEGFNPEEVTYLLRDIEITEELENQDRPVYTINTHTKETLNEQ